MNPNKSHGRSPIDGLYLCTATAGPGKLILWINGEAVLEVEDTTESGMVSISEEVELYYMDVIEFEAIPGPLLDHDHRPLKRL